MYIQLCVYIYIYDVRERERRCLFPTNADQLTTEPGGGLGRDVDLRLLAGNGDLVAEVASLAADLDAVKEEALERLALEEPILERHRVIDGELHELFALGVSLFASLPEKSDDGISIHTG